MLKMGKSGGFGMARHCGGPAFIVGMAAVTGWLVVAPGA